MKKLIPILLTIFILLSAQVALGTVEIKMSGSGAISPQSFQTITGGVCSIADNYNGSISIYGSTTTNRAVQQIGVKLNLQYLSGGQWHTLNNYSYNNYQSNYISGGRTMAVSRGYNYRVFAQHTSLDGGISESGNTYSNSIYIP